MKIIKIKIIANDVNNNQPEFPHKQINIEFLGGGVSKVFKNSIPNAIDKDVGSVNSKITYELQKDNSERFSLKVYKRPFEAPKLRIVAEEKLH